MEAADLMVAGQRDDALDKIMEADLQSLTDWFDKCAQQDSIEHLKALGIENPRLRKAPKKIKKRRDTLKLSTKRRVFARDGWHCRFCGVRIIDPEVMKSLGKDFPEIRWGGNRANKDRHGCVGVVGSIDHVLPCSWGGINGEDNLIAACWACQFSKMEYLIEDLGLCDPRDRPAVKNAWDGLRRVLIL